MTPANRRNSSTRRTKNSGVAARQLAAEGLLRIERDGAFANIVLSSLLNESGLEQRDKGFATELVYGCPRMRRSCDWLVFLGTPPHAAVDTSVRLVEDAGLHHLKGLVNAVLRRISRDGDALLVDRDPARLNTPRWLWENWIHAYGEDTTRAIASAHLHEAPLDITVRRDADHWAGQLEAEKLPTGTLRRKGGGHIAELPGFAEGIWWVQDAAAALPARLLGDVTDKRVADLCAAPGGKTMQLCAAGAKVTAVDISARRMMRLGENLARAGLEAELVTADASKWTPEEKFDAILLDAPCSGTGTLRRHPDIAWLKGPAQARRHPRLCGLLAAGGRGSGAHQ